MVCEDIATGRADRFADLGKAMAAAAGKAAKLNSGASKSKNIVQVESSASAALLRTETQRSRASRALWAVFVLPCATGTRIEHRMQIGHHSPLADR
jgi:hypothetical protein